MNTNNISGWSAFWILFVVFIIYCSMGPQIPTDPEEQAKRDSETSAEVWVKNQLPLTNKDYVFPLTEDMTFIKQPNEGYEVKASFEFHPEDGGVEQHAFDVFVGPPVGEYSFREVESGSIL